VNGTRPFLRQSIASQDLLLVPLVFDALTALMCRRAGFAAGYVGGAALGYLRGVTEAALTPHDFVEVGLEIRAQSDLALIMDAGCGWGDPMHIHRVVKVALTAGYDAIELEDQVAPKRAHHHIGIEHLVSVETMTAKIREAVRARGEAPLLIIARTNAVKINIDDAVQRCDAYAGAGADVLFPIAYRPEDLAYLGKRAPSPLMQMVHPGASFTKMGLTHQELTALNYRLLVDGITPFSALYHALAHCYEHLRSDTTEEATIIAAMKGANDLVGLDTLLKIERETTEANLFRE